MMAEHKRLWTWTGWALVAILAGFWVVDLVGIWGISNHKDLAVFLRAGERLIAGGDIYMDVPRFQMLIESGQFSMLDVTIVWPYAYAPIIAMMFAPLTRLPAAWVNLGWWLFNVFSLLATVLLVASAMRVEMTPLRAGALLLLLYRYYPATVALRLGQIEIMQALLLSIGLWAATRRKEALAGGALGLATALKFFPGALIALYIWRRRWKASAWAIGVAALFIMGSFAYVGFDRMGAYVDFGSIYGIGGPFAAFPLNQSINGLCTRNLIHNVFTATLKGWHIPWLAKTLTVVADVMVVAVCAVATWHRFPWTAADGDQGDGAEHRRFCLEYGMVIAAVLLVSPHSQLYSYVWLLIPLAVCALWLMDADSPRTVALFGALVAAYLLVGRIYELYVPGLTRIVEAHPLWGATLLWGVLVIVLGGLVRQERSRLWLE